MRAVQTLTELFIEHGTLVDMPLNYRIFLHDEDSLFWLEEGDLDIFSLDPQRDLYKMLQERFSEIAKSSTLFFGDEIKGGLNFLRNAESGTLLFGFGDEFKIGKPLIIAISNEPTKLRKMSIEKLRQLLTDQPELNSEIDTQIHNWISQLSHIFLYRKQPKYLIPIDIESNRQIEANKQIIPAKTGEEKIVWMDLSEGEIEITGLQTLTLRGGDSYYPLSVTTWIQTPTPVNLSLKSVHPILPNFHCFQGLKIFHKTVIDALFFSKLSKGRIEKNKIKKQEIFDEKNLDRSLKELANIFSTDVEEPPIIDANLTYRCCQFIGKSLNLKFIPLPYDRQLKFSSPAQYLNSLCKNSQIQYRQVALTGDWWTQGGVPLLCFYGDESLPLALVPLSQGRYQLYNPQTGLTEQFVREQFPDMQSYAYVFYRALPNKDEVSNWEILSFVLHGRKLSYLMFGFFALLLTLFSTVTPILTQQLYSVVVPNLNYVMFAQIGFGFALIALSTAVFSFCREYVIIGIQNLIDQDFAAAIWQRLLSFSTAFFRKYQVGDLFIRTQIVSTLKGVFTGNTLRQTISSLFSLVYLVPMFYYNASLAWIGMAILIPALVLLAIVPLFLNKLNKISLEQRGELNEKVLETLHGINAIRTYGCENRFFARWEEIFFQNKMNGWKIAFLGNIVSVTYTMISPISLAIIYSFMISQVVNSTSIQSYGSSPQGFVGVGEFMGFYMAFSAVSGALLAASGNFLQFVQITPAWKRARIFFDEHPENSSSRVKPELLTGEIRIDNLYFRYAPNDPQVLTGLSLRVKPGELVAIVGHSGCGKSTLVRCLIGFETPMSGAVYYDNRDLENLDLQHIRSQMGIVLQNSSIIDGTLRDNVMTGSIYSDTQILNALKMAGFGKDLDQLPMGLDTVLMNGGSTFSGGQKQKILIARALIGTPKILIFDEASSALDNETQHAVTQNLKALNTTRIVIAHRLSTIIDADRIYVMHEGKVEEEGTFKELSQRKGRFTELLLNQTS